VDNSGLAGRARAPTDAATYLDQIGDQDDDQEDPDDRPDGVVPHESSLLLD
jgi:hypothetical protein